MCVCMLVCVRVKRFYIKKRFYKIIFTKTRVKKAGLTQSERDDGSSLLLSSRSLPYLLHFFAPTSFFFSFSIEDPVVAGEHIMLQ